MRLIDFLLNNIVYVIIALGILTSLWKKKQNGHEGRSRPMMPTFGGDTRGMANRPIPQMREMRQEPRPMVQDERKTIEQLPMQAEQPPLPENERSVISEQRPMRNEQLLQRPDFNRERITSMNQPGENTRDISPLHVDADEMLKGLIWLEVLGEPRAKKPYLYRRMVR